MNNLSWLIYFGSVSGSLGTFFVFLAVMCGLLSVPSIVMSIVFSGGEKDRNVYLEINRYGAKILKYSIFGFIFFGVVSCLLPSRDAVYAIAVSEVGGKIANSEVVTDLGQEAMQTLKEWLRQQRSEKK